MLNLKNGEVLNLEELLLPEAKLKINASITRHNDSLLCAYRTGNLDEYDSRNYITEFNENLQPLSHRRLTSEDKELAFEDVRLFSLRNRLIALYTYLPGNKRDGWKFRYGVGIGEVELKTGTIRNNQSLRIHAAGGHSKNWVPVLTEKDLFLVTDYEPHLKLLRFVSLSDNFDCEKFYCSSRVTKGWKYGQIRGGTPFISSPLPDDDWKYSFVHSDVLLPNGSIHSRFYVYTLLRLSLSTNEFQYCKVPLGHSNNEPSEHYNDLWLSATRHMAMRVVFPMGIINYNEGILMSYGKDDCVSRLVFYDWKYLTGLFD
jgi:hypothetical protein